MYIMYIILLYKHPIIKEDEQTTTTMHEQTTTTMHATTPEINMASRYKIE